MLSPTALEVAATEVESDDFYKPSHSHIHDAMRRLWEGGINRIDPVLVADELENRGLMEAVGGPAVLIGIQAVTPATSNASRYARVIVEHATARRLISAAGEIAEIGYTLGGGAGVAEAVDQAKYLVNQCELPVAVGDPSPSVDQFLMTEDEFDWLVPGLLERRDRLILTGGEGGGKSTLLRQLAVTFAAGMHPFKFHPVEPITVLVIDVENSPSQVRRSLAPMIDRIDRRHGWNPENLRIECRTELDLTQRHDSHWLLERVASNRPDIILTGPIYKLHSEDPNDELPARKVQRVFDMIRSKYDCALVIEAHSPHGDAGGRRPMRPTGTSAWMRWPEFGYGLRPDREAGEINGHPAAVWFESWRGPRDQREWPVRLSGDGKEFWPWRDSAHRVYAEPEYDPGHF